MTFRAQLHAIVARNDDCVLPDLTALIERQAVDPDVDQLLLLAARSWLVLLLGRSLSPRGIPRTADLDRVDEVNALIRRRNRVVGYDPHV